MEKNKKFGKTNINDSLSHRLALKTHQITRLTTILASLIKKLFSINAPFPFVEYLKIFRTIPTLHMNIHPLPFYSLLAIEIQGN